MPAFPGFVGPSYTSQSPIADCERCVNLYVEKIESPNGKSAFVLYPCPGFTEAYDLPTDEGRGSFTQNGRTFVVFGSVLYELFANENYIQRGTGLSNPDGTPATFASNGRLGNQLFITSGTKGYIYNLDTNTLTFVVDDASMGAFIDGFFVKLNTSESKFEISDLNNGLVWDPTQAAQRNTASDSWVAMLVSHRQIWLFGSQTTDIWFNDGGSPFPFTANEVLIDVGIAAPNSLTDLDNAPAWLGGSKKGGYIVYRANGYAAQRISTHAVEFALAGYTTVADAEGWAYSDQGHEFYVLTFPTANKTWVYDASTGVWHERGVNDGYGDFTALPVAWPTFAFGSHLVLSRTTGKVYTMSTDTFTEVDGAPRKWLRRTPHVASGGRRIRLDNFLLEMEMGLGALPPAPTPTLTDWTFTGTDGANEAVAWSPTLSLFVSVGNLSLQTSPDGSVWTARTDPVAFSEWRGIAWSPALALFVVVGGGGANRAITSPDGITWTARTIDSNLWAGVTWSPELALFVAVASGGQVATSPDGITWTNRTASEVSGWQAVAWSPSLTLFVAVAASTGTNRVMTSPDGITWTSRTVTTGNWVGIAWSQELSLFAAVGFSSGNIMTSPDGITWTTRTSPSNIAARAVAWGAEAFVAVGVVGQKSLTSADGITWTEKTAPIGTTGIAWAPSLETFAAVGFGNGVIISSVEPPDPLDVTHDANSNPMIAVRTSQDGGKTYGNVRTMSAGARGAYRQQAMMWRFGQARDWVFDVSGSAAIPYRITGAQLNVPMGSV